MRFEIVFALAATLCVACSSGDPADAGMDGGAEPADEGVVVGPDGAVGLCCPVSPAGACGTYDLGGWADDASSCDLRQLTDVHADDLRLMDDEYGCPRWREVDRSVCCLCPDAGPPPGP